MLYECLICYKQNYIFLGNIYLNAEFLSMFLCSQSIIKGLNMCMFEYILFLRIYIDSCDIVLKMDYDVIQI